MTTEPKSSDQNTDAPAQEDSREDLEAEVQRHLERKAAAQSRAQRPRRPSSWKLLDLPCPEGCGETVTVREGAQVRICDTCQGKRVAEELRQRREAQELRETERLKARRDNLPEWLGRAGAPSRYQAFTRARWEEKWKPWQWQHLSTKFTAERLSLDQLCDAWLSQQEPSRDWLIVMFGKHGRRKTGLGTAILGEAICRGGSAVWIDFESWIDQLEYGLREPHGSDPKWRPWAETFRRAVEAEWLLIDDLAALRAGRTGGRWWQERASQLLRQREAWQRPTIVNANMEDLEELAHINHSLPSRMTVRLSFKLGGKDFRPENRS